MSLLAYLQYQALFLWLVLAAGWTWSGVNRRRERLRRLQNLRAATAATATWSPGWLPPAAQEAVKSTGSQAPGPGSRAADRGGLRVGERRLDSVGGVGVGGGAAAATDAMAVTTDAAVGGAPAGLAAPPVSVVMPVKGCRLHSRDNWESHLAVQYDGPIEFVFVVESEDDPAVPTLLALQRRHAASQPSPADRTATAKEHRTPGVPEAASGAAQQPPGGAAGTCAAKAAAVRDVRLVVAGLATSCSQKAHNLCAGIERCDPRVSRDRGYVLCLDDDVALHPGTLTELVEQMEERRGELFMATGYPFDLPPPGSSFPAYLALCYHLPLLIAFSVAPDTAFVWGGCMLLRGEQLLPNDPAGLLAAWRHGGYSDDLILASFCSERGLRITVPPFAVFPQKLDPDMTWRAWLNYLHRQLFVLDTYTNDHNRKTNHTMMVLHSVLSWLLVLPSLAALLTVASWTLARLLLLLPLSSPAAAAAARNWGLLPLPGSGGGSIGSAVAGAGSAAAAATEGPAALGLLPGGVWAVFAGWTAAHLALVFMTAEILGLFRLLSLASPPIPLSLFRWGRLWAAMLLSNAVLPLVMAYTYCCPRVEWGGVVYRKRRGLVTPVGRTHVSVAAGQHPPADAVAPTGERGGSSGGRLATWSGAYKGGANAASR